MVGNNIKCKKICPCFACSCDLSLLLLLHCLDYYSIETSYIRYLWSRCWFFSLEIIKHHLLLNLLPSSISPFFLLLSSIFHNLPAGFSDVSLVFSSQPSLSPPFHPPLLWSGGKVEETTEVNTRTEWPRESTHTTCNIYYMSENCLVTNSNNQVGSLKIWAFWKCKYSSEDLFDFMNLSILLFPRWVPKYDMNCKDNWLIVIFLKFFLDKTFAGLFSLIFKFLCLIPLLTFPSVLISID